MPDYPPHILSPILAQGGLDVSGLNVPLSIGILVVSVLGYALVNSIEIAVVLPAPLGPSKPNTSPRATWSEMPFTASLSPYDFFRS